MGEESERESELFLGDDDDEDDGDDGDDAFFYDDMCCSRGREKATKKGNRDRGNEEAD